MADQPNSEKPLPVPAAVEPKPAEKPPVKDVQPTKPEAAALPVTEKMPPMPAPVEAAPKPPQPVFPRVDTKPVAAPSDGPAPEKNNAAPVGNVAPKPVAPAADGKPAVPAEAASAPAATPASSSTTKPVEPLPVPAASAPQPPAPQVPLANTAAPASPEAKPAPLAPTEKMPDPPAPAAKSGVTAPLLNKDDTLPPNSNQRVTQRFSDPGSAATVQAGTICPSCGHRNRPGTLICDNCGTNLIAGVRGSIGTRDLESATKSAAPQDQAILTDTQSTAIKSAGSTEFNEDMVLRIEIEGGSTPMLVYPKSEIIMGRRDPNTGTLPDVDLTAYAGYRMGVSRTHASIRLQDKVLNLSDRGSSNGTFLNGNRLTAHHPYPLRDGDEIRLGQMLLKIYFQTQKKTK